MSCVTLGPAVGRHNFQWTKITLVFFSLLPHSPLCGSVSVPGLCACRLHARSSLHNSSSVTIMTPPHLPPAAETECLVLKSSTPMEGPSELEKNMLPRCRACLLQQRAMPTHCGARFIGEPHKQPVRLLVSARAYQPANSVFLSQQISTSRAYQPRNQLANRLKNG